MRDWIEESELHGRMRALDWVLLVLQALIWLTVATARLAFRLFACVCGIVIGFIVGFILVRRLRR
jgi:hypothetical protein